MENSANAIKRKTEDILLNLGIAPNILGFGYICDGVDLAITNPVVMRHLCKVLYPEIAKKNATTSARVERGIRHAIDLIYSRADLDELYKTVGFFGSYDKGKATAGEFISAVALKVKRSIEL